VNWHAVQTLTFLIDGMLPDEILLHHLFPYLQSFGEPHLLRECALVNRQWFEWSTPLLWSQLYLSTYAKVESFVQALASVRHNYGPLISYLQLPQTLIDSITADISMNSSLDELLFDDENSPPDINYREMAITRSVFPIFIRNEFYQLLATKLTQISAITIRCCLPSPENLCILLGSNSCQFTHSLRQLDLGVLDRNPLFRQSDSGFKSALLCLANLREMRDLRVGSSRLNDQIFLQIVAAMPHLTRLRLDQTHDTQFTDQSISQLAKSCGNLRTLDINYVPAALGETLAITDHSVIKLTECCNQLTHLTLFATQITDLSLISLSNNSKHLESIDLSFTPSITRQGLQQAFLMRNVTKQRRPLKTITVQSCAQISDADQFIFNRHSGVFIPMRTAIPL
jgi:hypothetical protein